MMHDSARGMSWKCKTHLEFNDIQAASFLFLPFHDINVFRPLELLSGHQQEDSGRTGMLRVEMCETGCWKRYSADLSWRSDDMVFGELGSGHWEHRGRPLGTEQRRGSYGTADALRHFKQSDGFLLVSQQDSVINRKGSHVKKKPFQLQPLELQCRTHT